LGSANSIKCKTIKEFFRQRAAIRRRRSSKRRKKKDSRIIYRKLIPLPDETQRDGADLLLCVWSSGVSGSCFG